MTEAAKPTKGPYTREDDHYFHKINGTDGKRICNVPTSFDSANKANADIIEDFLRVYYDTGKTPRELIDALKFVHSCHDTEMITLERMAAENKRLRSDAERYLWLKKKALKSGSEYSDIVFDLLRADNTDNWDASIDQALAQEPMK